MKASSIKHAGAQWLEDEIKSSFFAHPRNPFRGDLLYPTSNAPRTATHPHIARFSPSHKRDICFWDLSQPSAARDISLLVCALFLLSFLLRARTASFFAFGSQAIHWWGERLLVSPISANVQLVWAPWDNLAPEPTFFLFVLIFALAAWCRQNFQPERANLEFSPPLAWNSLEPKNISDYCEWVRDAPNGLTRVLVSHFGLNYVHAMLLGVLILLFILIFDSHLNICSCGCHTEVIGLAKIDGDGRRLNLQPAAAAVGFGQGTSLSHICTLNHWKNIFKTDLIIGEFTALDFFFKSLASRKKKCLSINNRVFGIIWVYIDPNLWQDFKKFSVNCKKEQQKIKQVSS